MNWSIPISDGSNWRFATSSKTCLPSRNGFKTSFMDKGERLFWLHNNVTNISSFLWTGYISDSWRGRDWRTCAFIGAFMISTAHAIIICVHILLYFCCHSFKMPPVHTLYNILNVRDSIHHCISYCAFAFFIAQFFHRECRGHGRCLCTGLGCY